MGVFAARRILVAQPQAILREFMVEGMRDLGAAVASALTGTQAAGMMAAQRYDLALVNATLPDMPGIELARLAAQQNVPAVIVCGHPGRAAELGRHGCAYVQKPFGLEDLRKASEQAIRESQKNILQAKAAAARAQANVAALALEVSEARRLLAEMQARFGSGRRDWHA